MNSQGRREKLKTVEILVSLLLQDPNQTRKDLMDKMTGKGMSEKERSEIFRGISRQSVYKALDFIRDAGILLEKSDQIVLGINKKTIKSITLSIDLVRVSERYADLRIEKLKRSERFMNLPGDAKDIVLRFLKLRFYELDVLDLQERGELLISDAKNFNAMESVAVLEYMWIEDIGTVMEYLRLFSELRG